MSSSRPSFRAAAAQRLAEDGGALPPAIEAFLSDTRRMAIRLLPVRQIALHPSRQAAWADSADGPDDGIASLLESVRQLGVLEPVLVRPLDGGRFELVSGERRLRAARAAHLETIPAVVHDLDDATAEALAAARVAEQTVGAEAGRAVTGQSVKEGSGTAGASGAAADGRRDSPRPVEVPPGPDVLRGGDAARGGDPTRFAEPYRIGDSPRPRRATNGTYMPPAVVTRREPVVISGPGIPGPSAVARDREVGAPEQRAVGDDADRRPRFRFAPFPFLRRSRNGSEDHR